MEKILGAGEQLPSEWPVHGTTGYEFAAAVNNLFVDRRNERALERYLRALHPRAARSLVVCGARLPEQEAGAARDDVGRHQLARTSAQPFFRAKPALPRLHALQPDLDDQGSHRLLPRLSDLRHRPTSRSAEHDRRYIVEAVRSAKRRAPALTALVFDFIEHLLLKETAVDHDRKSARSARGSSASSSRSPARSRPKASRTPRSTCYNRLLSLNEVGSDPTGSALDPAGGARLDGRSPASAGRRRCRRLSTHDTQARRGRAGADQRPVGDSRRMEGGGRRSGAR